jgi:aminoglycoside phosphotransferase (APT) family kinase protein
MSRGPGLARAIEAAWPGRAPGGCVVLATGFGSIVADTGTGMILRIGRTARAARGHAVEAAVLPDLAQLLAVPVPVPVLYRPPAAALPFGAIGSRRLPGEPATPATVTAATGRDLGAFLATLHQLDPGSLPAMPAPRDVWEGWLDLRAASEPVLRHRLASGENARISRWRDRFVTDSRLQDYQPAVRHGDLWYGNLLTGPGGRITAVLDWEAVAVADPAQDLAVCRYLGSSFTSDVIEAYRWHGGNFDDAARYRADRHWELRELTGIPLAAATGDDAEISECIAKLRAGPLLSQ